MADVVAIGGANIDIKAKAVGNVLPGTSNPGTVTVSPGGVARNIAHNLAVLGENVALLAAIGNDAASETLLAASRDAGIDMSHAMRVEGNADTYVATLDGKGELVAAINAMPNVARLDAAYLETKKGLLKKARYMIADCNLEAKVLRHLVQVFGAKLLIDPVSVPKVQRLLEAGQRFDVLALTPNRDQLAALTGTSDVAGGCRRLHARGVANVVVHLGANGALVSQSRGMKEVPGAPRRGPGRR
ncbi:MAG: carbohydrate kinase [Rhizobiales bacterium]|nr:carbohydrate kinase [Hyphomicrobiales bacterium]